MHLQVSYTPIAPIVRVLRKSVLRMEFVAQYQFLRRKDKNEEGTYRSIAIAIAIATV